MVYKFYNSTEKKDVLKSENFKLMQIILTSVLSNVRIKKPKSLAV